MIRYFNKKGFQKKIMKGKRFLNSIAKSKNIIMNRIFRVSSFVIFYFLFCGTVNGQVSTLALPTDGNVSQSSAPQGGFRYQRGFYLIKPSEMLFSGLQNGDTINCIGFNIALAQSDTTRGNFKVYLQNTTDMLSRVDTAWTMISGITNNFYKAINLFPGNFEWMVKTNCSSFSPTQQFTSVKLENCQPPTHLQAKNITDMAATLKWVSPISMVSQFKVEFKLPESINWTTTTTSLDSVNISGLLPNKNYLWRVSTLCTSDSSIYASNNFQTENADKCNEPTSLMNGAIGDTTAVLKWTGASGANYYTIRFRRVGSSNWNSTISFTDSLYINSGLTPGTLHEWQIATNCGSDSSSAYVKGNNFMTLGTLACYPPDFFSTDSISTDSSIFFWSATPGASSYELWYRAKNKISWDLATNPMTLVHNDSITIPNTTGPYTIPFQIMNVDTFFKYTGGGLYIAWEYDRPLGDFSTFNTSLTTKANTVLKGSFGQDSINYILSYIATSDTLDTGLDSILYVTNQRPETYFCSPNISDSVAVLSVYALGKNAPRFSNNTISAAIKNYQNATITYPVTLVVKDKATNAIRCMSTQNITIPPDTFGIITFNSCNVIINETDSIIVSVAPLIGEDVVNNNSNFYIQMVNPNIVSYADESMAISETGTDTMGLTLNRHFMDGCGTINSVQVYLSRSSIGHTVYGIALDSNRVVLAISPSLIPDSTQINKYFSFYFPNTRILQNELYYVGLAQTMDVMPYKPVGIQFENFPIRDSAYFRGSLYADTIWHSPNPGRPMIRAEIIPGTVSSISGNLLLCPNVMGDTLVASSILARYANSVIAASSEYSPVEFGAIQTLGTPNAFPNYGSNPAAWLGETNSSREFIVVKFPSPDSVNFIDIYETFNTGAIDSIYFEDVTVPGVFNLVWYGTAQKGPNVAIKNKIEFPSLTNYKVSAVRLAFNTAAVGGLTSVDAICIGKKITPGIFSSISWSGSSIGSNDSLIITLPGGYKLTTIDASGCMSMDSITVTTPLSITPLISAEGPITFCPGDSVKLKSNLIGGNLWSNGSRADSIYVKTAGNNFVKYFDGCDTTQSNTISITLFTPPTVNITGDTVICPGGSTTLDAGPGFTSYLWSSQQTSQTINQSFPSWNQVTVTDMNGCKASDAVFTVWGTPPSPMISGTLEFCTGDSTTLYAGTGYATYLWSNGSSADSIKVNTAGTFMVTVTDIHGCSGVDDETTVLFAQPNAIISGKNGFCPQDSVMLTASGGMSYLWSTGSTLTSINVKTPGIITLTVIDINGCKDTASKNIIELTPPSPIISGALSFCDGGSSTTLKADPGYTSYLWSTGETSPSITVTTIDTFFVKVIDQNGCMGTSGVRTSNDGAVPAVPGVISGPTSGQCNILSPSMYSISPMPNTDKYYWEVPVGATIESGQGTTSIKVSFDQFFTGGNISVQGWNPCGLSPAYNGRYLYVSATPGSVPGTISGTTSGVCKIGTGTYSIPPVTGATAYIWTVPLGATILTGQGTPSINVSFASSYKAGDICVQYNTLCGPSPFECVTVIPTPVIESPIQGISVVCVGKQNEVYSVIPAVGATSYEWTVPSDASIVSGQGTNQISVNFGSRSGIVTVRPLNLCGSSTGQVLPINVIKCDQFNNDDRQFKKVEYKFDVSIFPNPSDGNINVQFGELTGDNTFSIAVVDVLGRTVYNSKLSVNKNDLKKLNLHHLGSGIYTLNIWNQSQHSSSKLVLR